MMSVASRSLSLRACEVEAERWRAGGNVDLETTC